MRRMRGVKNLVRYLESIGAPMSESTVYRLLRVKKIPHLRPSPGILIFDLDAIDNWLTIDENEDFMY